MRFLDKRLLFGKLYEIGERRNPFQYDVPPPTQIHFSSAAMFVGVFFKNIADDDNTKEILHELAVADEAQLDTIYKLLVFWWFWSIDRNVGRKDLSNEDVLTGLRIIWNYREADIQQTTAHLDSKMPLETNELWRMICEVLGKDLSPTIAFIHMSSAQKEALAAQQTLVNEVSKDI